MNVLIADDEALARRRLQRLLAAMSGVEVVGECTDGLQVLEAVRDGGIDVVLLDVQMPDLTGVEALRLLDEAGGPAVILCTAHAEHAVDAFDGGAVDYLLKPVDAGRLARALQRARARLQRTDDTQGPRPAAVGRLPLATARGIVMVDHDAITHARIEGASVVLHTTEARLFTDTSLSELERRLPADAFLRVHRKTLIALRHLERLEPIGTGGYRAHLAGGAVVEVSRAAARDLRRRWSIV